MCGEQAGQLLQDLVISMTSRTFWAHGGLCCTFHSSGLDVTSDILGAPGCLPVSTLLLIWCDNQGLSWKCSRCWIFPIQTPGPAC